MVALRLGIVSDCSAVFIDMMENNTMTRVFLLHRSELLIGVRARGFRRPRPWQRQRGWPFSRDRGKTAREKVCFFSVVLGVGLAVGLGFHPVTSAAYRPPLRSQAGAVAADHELASQAGAEVLAQGGNAVDAAVATALALGVVQPSGSGLGGGGFLVSRRADGKVEVLDFREVAPKRAQPDMYLDKATGQVVAERSRHGGLAVGVPGEAAGFALALRELGQLGAKNPAQIVAPALRLAREGFSVGRHLCRSAELVVPKLLIDNPLRAMLAPAGTPLKVGEYWRRPELASTLETLGREGFLAFYKTSKGPTPAQPGANPPLIGDEILRAVQAAGGLLTAEDLRAYRPVKRQALEGNYRGWHLYSVPPPGGGMTAIEALQILDARPPLREGPLASSTLHEIIEAFKHAFSDRARYLGDPDFDKVPVAELTSPSYATQRAAQVQLEGVLPSEQYGQPKKEGDQPAQAPRDHGTTHICVIDKDGNAAAITTTVNLSFGAHLVAGRTGVLLNNQMDDFAAMPNRPNAFGLVGNGANGVAAGKRPASSMTPLIAVAPDGSVLCVGGSGGPTIVTGVVQTLINIVDFHMNVEAAVSAPRIHEQFIPDRVSVEPEIPADVRAGLQRRGHKLLLTPHPLETAVQAVLWHKKVGRSAAVEPSSTAVRTDNDPDPRPFSAASDPRKGGLPAAP